MGQGGCWGWLTPLELIGIVIYIFSEINKKRRGKQFVCILG